MQQYAVRLLRTAIMAGIILLNGGGPGSEPGTYYCRHLLTHTPRWTADLF